jgi:biopolymer transport protein ExbD
MKIRAEEPEAEANFQLTPMIDIVFNLLIFFMASTTFLVRERQLEVDLPPAENGSAAIAPEELVLNVLQDGRVVWRGTELDDAGLADVLAERARTRRESLVTIRGHRAARHESIVRVMDACATAGLANLAIGTQESGG